MSTQPQESANVMPFGTSEPHERDLASRNAFGRAISLDYWSVDVTVLDDVAPKEEALTEPSRLQSGLFTAAGFSVGGVSLKPEEYTAIVRSPKALAKAVMAKTLEARQGEPNFDSRQAAAARSVQHAFEGKTTTLSQMRLGLSNEAAILRALAKEARAPGYAHYAEGQMRQLMTYVWTYTFPGMVEVNAYSQKWDGPTYNRAQLALVKHLLTGPQRLKVGKWREMIDLASRYNRAKQGLTRDRLAKISRY